MKGRIKEDDVGVPAPDRPFAYYTRFVVGGQHPLFCRKPRDGGEEQVLLDGNALAELHAYFRITGVTHSPDHRLIAYAVDTKGLGVLHGQRDRGSTGSTCRFARRRQQRLAGMGRRQPHPPLHLARRRAPPSPRAAAHSGRRDRRQSDP